MTLPPRQSQAELDREAAAAYLATGSYRKAAAVVFAARSTVRERTRRFLLSLLPTLPIATQKQIREAMEAADDSQNRLKETYEESCRC